MKKLLLTITFAFICIQYKAQTIAYVSPQKDTLMLPNDDLGKMIQEVWCEVPNAQQPVIILTDEDTIKAMNVLYETRKKKKAKI